MLKHALIMNMIFS